MKLVYWIAESYENRVFSIRGKRRRDVIEELRERGYDPRGNDDFAPPHKVEVEYDNAFDLLDQCLGEGGIFEGSEAAFAAGRAFDEQFARQHVSIVQHSDDDDDEYETLEGVPPEREREYGAHDPDWYADA